MVYVNVSAVVVVVVIFVISFFIHIRTVNRLMNATWTTFIAVFGFSLLYTMNQLSDLTDLNTMGNWLSFAILVNAYSAILLLIIRVRQSILEWK